MLNKKEYHLDVCIENEECCYIDYRITKFGEPFSENEQLKLENCRSINMLKALVSLGKYQYEEIEDEDD